jgi:hypothetical protein
MTRHPIPPVWTLCTADLFPIERGALADIAAHYAQHGRIPETEAEFAALSRISVDEWREIAKPVLEAWERVKPLLFPAPRRKRSGRS